MYQGCRCAEVSPCCSLVVNKGLEDKRKEGFEIRCQLRVEGSKCGGSSL